MKWFKHFTNAHNDNAIKKVRMKYGSDGYAIYWYCLELIAGDLGGTQATFELSHDAEVIGYDLKIDQIRVEEIMKYMISLSLFESKNNTITCLKLAKFLDEKNTRNPEMIQIIKQVKSINVSDISGLVSDSPRLSSADQIRLDKNRIEKKEKKNPAQIKTRFKKPSIQECFEYCRNQTESESFFNYYESNGWKVGRNKMVNWKSSLTNWVKRSQDFNHQSSQTNEPETWL